MTSRDFCFWLQGFIEIGRPKELNDAQVKIIMRHLQLVFIHEIDPSMPNPKLDAVHNSDPSKILMRC